MHYSSFLGQPSFVSFTYSAIVYFYASINVGLVMISEAIKYNAQLHSFQIDTPSFPFIAITAAWLDVNN